MKESLEMKIDLDSERQLFVITSGGSVSCFGYDNVRRDTARIARTLQRDDLQPTVAERASVAGYTRYRAACEAWANSVHSRRTWFAPGTDGKVALLLERYRESGRMLRVFLGDRATGRDWMEENDVVGYVGRSGGSQKVPLLLVAGRNGGSALLTDCIVRLMDADGTELYRHPKYQVPALSLEREWSAAMLARGYAWAVWSAGAVQARFRSVYTAAEYVAFLTGRIATRRDQLVHALKAA
jgi:hypothetical protein